MVKLIASTVIRGSDQSESEGGVYIIDVERQDISQALDLNALDIDWSARGPDRGFNDIAIDGDTIYLLAGDELFAYTRDFKPIASWRNRYLKFAEALSIYERRLYIVSAGYDSVLGFELDEKRFSWALQIELERFNYSGSVYDPEGDEGPLLLNKLHLNHAHSSENGLYISGSRTEGMLHFNGEAVYMLVSLPEGIHDARPWRDGVLFNDCDAQAVRYASRSGEEDRAVKVPDYDLAGLTKKDADNSGRARQAFGRGLCPINDRVVAAGSSPSTVSLFDLKDSKSLLSVNLSKDIRSAIHSLRIWPF